MLWFAVWAALVLAALAVGFLLWRDLWRRVKALVAELERASGVLARLEAAGLAPEPAPPGPPAVADGAAREAVRARRRQLQDARRHRGDARLAAALRRWQALGLVR